jgi:CHASE3 domain sensor protein
MKVIVSLTLMLVTGRSIRHVRDHLRARRDATARREINRQERVNFTVYLALAVLNMLFLTATGVAWWLRG